MFIIGTLAATGLSFLFLALLFIPLERLFASKKQSIFRPAWFLDACFFLGQYLLWSSAVFFLLEKMDYLLEGWVPASLRTAVAGQPWWLQVVEVMVLSDFLIYWGHRWQHKNTWLWRFHSIHHSAEHLDWLAAHREHPLDTVFTVGLVNLPALILGFPLETLGGFIAFRGLWAIFIHSNVNFTLGPLRVLIGSPELHHWHHDRARDAGNYANLSPLMDLLFGTYRNPSEKPEAYGVSEPMPQTYLGMMCHPFSPRKKEMTTNHPPSQARAETSGES